GGTVLIRQALSRDDLQRARLVLVAPQHAFFFQRADVLEDSDLAGAELVGQFLHGGRIAMQMAVVANRHQHIQLAGREIHMRPRLKLAELSALDRPGKAAASPAMADPVPTTLVQVTPVQAANGPGRQSPHPDPPADPATALSPPPG